MTPNAAALRAELYRRYPRWKPDLALAGEGFDFIVYRAAHPVWGDISIKVPRTRFINNDNDDNVDTRCMLRQEAALNNLFADHGMPTPRAYDVHLEGDDTDYIIAPFVRHDQSTPPGHECGALLARIHSVAPPANFVCVAQIEESLSETISTLIVRRTTVVERLAGVTLPLPSGPTIRQALDCVVVRPSILHMDYRSGNVLAYEGRVAGIVDWGNALIGDPALETARIAEYGLWDAEFAAGYGGDPLTERPLHIDHLYRLYTATMLAVVFLSEAPDRGKASALVKRVQHLLQTLKL